MRYERTTPVGNGCIVDTDVAGQGQEARIAPGEQVTITFDYQVWRNPLRVPIHQVVAGIGVDPLYGCLYNAIPLPYPGVSGTRSFGFVSEEPGIFEICVHWDLQYSCADAIEAYRTYRQVAATIEVTPEAPRVPATWILGPAAAGIGLVIAGRS